MYNILCIYNMIQHVYYACYIGVSETWRSALKVTQPPAGCV